jgi:site-specific recombinase XerD
MLAAIHTPKQIVMDSRPLVESNRWLDFFDPQAALEQVINHIETLPGSRAERHTMRAYLSSIADYARFMGASVFHINEENYSFTWDYMAMPNRAATADYIAHCKRNGLSSSTITRYMAAVRHFLKSLKYQEVQMSSGADYFFVNSAHRQFDLACELKNPPPDRTSNRPALEQHGTRLSLLQVNTLFSSFEAEIVTLAGKRDLALLYLGITSGLRAAELARLTLANITQGKDCYEVKVRGKRSNHDPIGIDGTAYELLNQFVNAWNETLNEDDTRRITRTSPIFQSLLKGSHIADDHNPAHGLTARAILKIVERRTQEALGSAITAHDMRRTCAFQMRSNGFEWDQIRAQLRHRSIGTTEKYVGQEQDLSRALLSKRVTFTIPHDARLPLGGVA